jgi:hypothetical protein
MGTLDVLAGKYQRKDRQIELMLFLAFLAFGAIAFVTLDRVYSALIFRQAQSIGEIKTCGVPDPVRHHAFKPNCESTEYWGGGSYKFFSNSLGFRDQKIREVPLADARPRILILGDSYVEGKLEWRRSFVGRIAEQFPQYDFLNGARDGYSPSNYLNTARMVLAKGVDIDEVIVFLDNSTVGQEAGFYRDIDASGSVAGPERLGSAKSRYEKLRSQYGRRFVLTFDVLRSFDPLQRVLIRHGYYHLPAMEFGDPFDMEMSAWSYRKVNETDPFPAGYAPLGVDGGIAKSKAKMTLLWEELQKRNIPLSVVVYPHLAQVVHDMPDSREVKMWREWCEEKCKRFITVFPEFFAVKNQCPWSEPGCWYPRLFVFGDIHFTAGGNALVADEVIKSLKQDPPGKHPAATPEPQARTSNLPSRIRSVPIGKP